MKQSLLLLTAGAAVGAGSVLLVLALNSKKRKTLPSAAASSSILTLMRQHQHDDTTQQDLALVKSCITSHEDFPLPGILFRDVFPIFQNPSAFAALLRLFQSRLQEVTTEVDLVLGLDARGFLLGPILAGLLNCSFAPVRKSGKLPGELATISYAKEYGADSFSIPVQAVKNGARVLVVDDLLATGGTLHAACELVHQLGGTVVECMVIIELEALHGRDKIGSNVPVWSLYKF